MWQPLHSLSTTSGAGEIQYNAFRYSILTRRLMRFVLVWRYVVVMLWVSTEVFGTAFFSVFLYMLTLLHSTDLCIIKPYNIFLYRYISMNKLWLTKLSQVLVFYHWRSLDAPMSRVGIVDQIFCFLNWLYFLPLYDNRILNRPVCSHCVVQRRGGGIRSTLVAHWVADQQVERAILYQGHEA